MLNKISIYREFQIPSIIKQIENSGGKIEKIEKIENVSINNDENSPFRKTIIYYDSDKKLEFEVYC